MKAIKNQSPPLPDSRLFFLDDMRAIAIIMIVGVHAISYSLELPTQQKDIIVFVVSTIAVPIFFLADGYLFSRSTVHSKSFNYIKYIKKSSYRLLIPWLIFTFLYSLARYASELAGFLEENIIIGASFQDVMISAYGSVYAPQLYFLFSLFLIRLCSPIIKSIAAIDNNATLLGILLAYYILYTILTPFISPYLMIPGGQEPILHALWGFQFYLLGIILFKISATLDLKKIFSPLVLIFILTLFIHKNLGSYGQDLLQYLYLLTFFIIFMFLHKGLRPLSFLGKNTMGMYLIHSPVILNLASLALLEYIKAPIISYFAVLAATLILTACVVWVINAIPYGPVLFGSIYTRSKK